MSDGSTGDAQPSQPPAASSWRERFAAFLARRSDFVINVAKLSGGTVVRTLIVFGAIPIVTRLYAPEDFGNLQLLLSIVAPFVAISTLKYELAIVLPVDRGESDRVAVLCLVVVCLFTLVLGALSLTFGDWFFGLFDAERLQPFAGLVAVGFLAGGLLRTTNFMLIANKHFGGLAQNNVIQVAITQSTNVGLGLWQPSFLGLFAGQMAGHVIAIAHALWRIPFRLAGVGAGQLVELAGRYRKFPLVNTPGVFVNTLAFEMPVFLLARFFDPEIVGFYMLTGRLLGQPSALIGDAVAKVYLQSAAEVRHRGAMELRTLYRRTAGRLLMVAAPLGVAIVVAAPLVVEFVLGEPYREVGVLMQILALARCMDLVVGPLGTTFSVVNRQEMLVALMTISAAARLVCMLIFSGSAYQMLLALSIATAVFGVIYLVVTDVLLTRLARDESTAAGMAARDTGEE